MKLKFFLWLLTLAGLFPVAAFLAMFVKIFSLSDIPLSSMFDTRSWGWHVSAYEDGNRFSDPTEKKEVELYPRVWTLLLGAVGALLLLIFTVYTLHIPYK